MQRFHVVANLAMLATAFATSAVLAEDARVTLAAGAQFTTGTYGGSEDIEDFYVPLSASIDSGRAMFRLTVPYLSVTAPEGTIIIGPGGEPLPGEGAVTTNSGIGDVIASVTLFDAWVSDDRNMALDLTGKIKFGTADETKGLGTGENDYTLQADLLKFIDDLTLIGSLGYVLRGDPAGADLDDALLASIGGSYRFSQRYRGGLFLDYRESSISGADPALELSSFVSRQLNHGWRVQFHLLGGLTDTSPDWGAGFRVRHAL